VQNGEVIIVDEFTGRLMAGRRWSDGLHQAVEAKEGVSIQRENQTLASITFQNYFRMYGKLAGMTGTADTEAFEFQQIYHLETVVIPTHLPMVRKDENDLVFRTFQEKVDAIIADIKDCHTRGQPVLVGTTSIENSELLSKYLEKEKLPHQVLNAKQHASEAQIVAQAGRPGVITIATNMAGRGTDIVLGGSIEPTLSRCARTRRSGRPRRTSRSTAARRLAGAPRRSRQGGGPAHHRHRAARVAAHRQPAARPLGRQGDPGSRASTCRSRIRCCASSAASGSAHHAALKMPEGEPIEHSIVNRSIAKAQNRVEARNFDIRKQLLEYDDVANDQRRVIYQQRNELLESADVADTIRNMVRGEVEDAVRRHIPGRVGRGAVGRSRAHRGAGGGIPDRRAVAEWLKSEGDVDEARSASASPTSRKPHGSARKSRSAPRCCASSSAASCSRRSTTTGASISRRSITCARASTCAAMRRRIRSRNTSARRSSSSRTCSTASRPTS
jgi:preprotein translocase subunit SecA